MVVCKLSIWPRGDESRAYDAGTVLIANAGGTATSGNYDVKLTKSASHGATKPGTWKRGAVNGFPRLKMGAYDLLLRALATLIGDRNPEAARAARESLEAAEARAEGGLFGPPEGSAVERVLALPGFRRLVLHPDAPEQHRWRAIAVQNGTESGAAGETVEEACEGLLRWLGGAR